MENESPSNIILARDFQVITSTSVDLFSLYHTFPGVCWPLATMPNHLIIAHHFIRVRIWLRSNFASPVFGEQLTQHSSLPHFADSVSMYTSHQLLAPRYASIPDTCRYQNDRKEAPLAFFSFRKSFQVSHIRL